MGTFIFPIYAHASEPPTIEASITRDILRIEITGGDLSVEAIFVNGQRFNYRVDDVLNVDMRIFDNADTISIYALDFAGRRSNVVVLENPFYVVLHESTSGTQGAISVQSNSFTPDGQATVLDHATTNEDDKEFFTFTTPAGNVFFLIIDHQRPSDNVYFLNAVTEQDLIALAEQSGNQIHSDSGIPVTILPEEDYEADQPEPPAQNNSNSGTAIFIIIAIMAMAGAGYYLKVIRPKQQAQASSDFDDDEDEDEDNGEEMEFENDPDENNENTDDYYDLNDNDDVDDEADTTKDDEK